MYIHNIDSSLNLHFCFLQRSSCLIYYTHTNKSLSNFIFNNGQWKCTCHPYGKDMISVFLYWYYILQSFTKMIVCVMFFLWAESWIWDIARESNLRERLEEKRRAEGYAWLPLKGRGTHLHVTNLGQRGKIDCCHKGKWETGCKAIILSFFSPLSN